MNLHYHLIMIWIFIAWIPVYSMGFVNDFFSWANVFIPILGMLSIIEISQKAGEKVKVKKK